MPFLLLDKGDLMELPYTINLHCKTGDAMKAIVYHKYGSAKVLKLEETDVPLIGEDQVLLRVRAVSLNPFDSHMMRGTPYIMRLSTGFLKPKYAGFGNDFAGKIEAIGKNVTVFKPGDEVFGGGLGGLAEFACAAQTSVVRKPATLTFEQAAAIPVAAITALQGLRDQGRIQPGQRVLINGASGGVGTFAVQIAKALGAEVTGVCSTTNLALVRSIGADHVIDYTQEDFTRNERQYDLLFDAVGKRSPLALRRVLTPHGMLVIVGGGKVGRFGFGMAWSLIKMKIESRFVSQKLVFMMAKRNAADLVTVNELIDADTLTPVIDRIYPLNKTADAIRYLETGHAKGKIVITL